MSRHLPSSASGVVLRARGVGKRFGGLPAVDGVDLDVREGEVLAVIGPNGAGKSTLLGIVNGTIRPSRSDELRFEGRELTGLAPHRIRRLGVATVLQTPRVFTQLTVLENVLVGAVFGGASPRPVSEARALALEALALVGLAPLAAAGVEPLGLHQKRGLELARALAGAPRLLLLDEVMAGLNPAEIDAYTAVLRRIRDERGVSVLWVEHVMRAVTALADRVVVLDAGRVIATGPPDEVVRDAAVVEAYLGREVAPMLRTDGLTLERGGGVVVRDVGLVVGDHEAVAVIGSNGAGKSTLLRAICGLITPVAGRIRYRGSDVVGVPAYQLARRGMAFVPSERALFGRMTVAENLAMGAFPHRPSRTRLDEVSRLFPRLAERRTQRAGTLSGGEQQMLAIARALMAEPTLLILDEPSTGLAPALVDETYAALARTREKSGTAVLVAEQQVPRALSLCDRAYVLEQGGVRLEGSTAAVAADPAVRRAYLGIG